MKPNYEKLIHDDPRPHKSCQRFYILQALRTYNREVARTRYPEHVRPVSSWMAIQKFGITRLSAVIYDLRNRGHDIKMEMVKAQPSGKRFGIYILIEEPDVDIGITRGVDSETGELLPGLEQTITTVTDVPEDGKNTGRKGCRGRIGG